MFLVQKGFRDLDRLANLSYCGGCPPRLLGPRQWLPVPCGGCPRRPLSRRRLRLLGPRQWLPVPCGGYPRRPLSRRRLLLLGPRLWRPLLDVASASAGLDSSSSAKAEALRAQPLWPHETLPHGGLNSSSSIGGLVSKSFLENEVVFRCLTRRICHFLKLFVKMQWLTVDKFNFARIILRYLTPELNILD